MDIKGLRRVCGPTRGMNVQGAGCAKREPENMPLKGIACYLVGAFLVLAPNRRTSEISKRFPQSFLEMICTVALVSRFMD